MIIAFPQRVGINTSNPAKGAIVYILDPNSIAYYLPYNAIDPMCKMILAVGISAKNNGNKLNICYTDAGTGYRLITAIEELPAGL